MNHCIGMKGLWCGTIIGKSQRTETSNFLESYSAVNPMSFSDSWQTSLSDPSSMQYAGKIRKLLDHDDEQLFFNMGDILRDEEGTLSSLNYIFPIWCNVRYSFTQEINKCIVSLKRILMNNNSQILQVMPITENRIMCIRMYGTAACLMRFLIISQRTYKDESDLAHCQLLVIRRNSDRIITSLLDFNYICQAMFLSFDDL